VGTILTVTLLVAVVAIVFTMEGRISEAHVRLFRNPMK
jgi:hypothetical protein